MENFVVVAAKIALELPQSLFLAVLSHFLLSDDKLFVLKILSR